MQTKIARLLSEPAFIKYEQKQNIFLDAMKEAVDFHKSNCAFYRDFLNVNGFDGNVDEISDIPPLPIGIFKERVLTSVMESEIVKITHSSATTTGKPSSIMIDRITKEQQRIALSKIMQSLLGGERRPFVIFESRTTLESAKQGLSSRATTIRGLLAFSSGFTCVLDKEFRLSPDLLEQALEKAVDRPPVFFGATYLLYKILQDNKNNGEIKAILSKFLDPTILFSGGWKKFINMNIDKELFKYDLSKFFLTQKNSLIDFYGMIEQPGVIYPECKYGYMHVPTYSEIIIRNLSTMQSMGIGKEGMIEVVSPLAHSYPGIALLTDDIGCLQGNDFCKCGRQGQFFTFLQRAMLSEAKGCSDTLEIPL